jgi:hypothetical protein
MIYQSITKGRIRRGLCALLGLLALSLGAGCLNPLQTPDTGDTGSQEGGGLVHIQVGEETGGARSIQPGASSVAGYRLVFSAGHEPVDITAGNSANIYLADGTYTITATAYKAGGTVGNAGDAAASGSISITLSGGAVTSNGGVVPPIILGPVSGAGSGTLEYTITSAAAVSGTMKLWEITGTTLVNGFGASGEMTIPGSPSGHTGTSSLAAGRYIAEIRLVNGSGNVAFLREVAEIWAGTTTAIVFEPAVYLDPSAAPVYRGAALSAASTIGGAAIGTGTGSGESEADPVSYVLAVGNIASAAQNLVMEDDSRFASLSRAATTGSAPGGAGYGDTPITNFSTNNVLWVKAVSEDLSTTRYYKFTLYPPPPGNGAFTDTDLDLNQIGGAITWDYPNPPAGISGSHIYYGSGPQTKLAGYEVPFRTVSSPYTESETVAANTALPSGAAYFLIYSYNSGGNDYPICLAVPIMDISFRTTYGSFTVAGIGGAAASGVSYSAPVLTISGAGLYRISGTFFSTDDRIVVQSGVTTDIMLENLNINVSRTSNTAAFDMTGATVNLTLAGTNTLKSGEGRAGLEAPYGSTLVITGSSTGSLAATGSGSGNSSSGTGGAGIGGGSNGAGGTVTIEGGTVTAAGGVNGAGIGGGNYSAGGTVTITGGTVTATGGRYNGAGIGGGGSGGAGGTVTIAGGTFTATGGSYGAGIGGGYQGAGGTVTITGGTVTARGGYGAGIGGAGIGGGRDGAAGSILEISGNAVVIASSIQPALPTGSKLANVIVIAGSTGTMYGDVTLGYDVTIPSDTALIIPAGGTLTIPPARTLTNNGTIYVETGGAITGTVSGNQPVGPSLTISGGSAYIYAVGILTMTGNGTYIIGMKSGVSVSTFDRVVVAGGVSADITLNGVHIDVSGWDNAAAFDMTGATVNLTLTGTNTLKSGEGRAGLEAPYGSTLVITGSSTGSLAATGGYGGGGGAGIGGGYNGTGGTVTIAGGTVTATGGGGGAGIGGGYNGTGGTVTITGGTVTATGGNNGAGIGGGRYGAGGTITEISGNAVVIASSIQPALPTGSNLANAIVMNGYTGTMYGDVTLGYDVTIPSGRTLDFLSGGQTLTIPGAVTLINEGTINKNGGTIVGTVGGGGPVNN